MSNNEKDQATTKQENPQPTPPTSQPVAQANNQLVAPAQAPNASAPRKAKKGLIVGIISAVVAVLLLLIAGLWYFLWYQNPERVLLTAITKAQQSKQVTASTVITSDMKYQASGAEVEFGRLEVDFSGERTPKIDANAKLSLKIDGESYLVQASVFATDSGEIYFKIANLKDSLIKSMKTGYKLSEKAQSHLDKIDGKWFKYGISDLKKSDKKAGEAAECALDAVKKNLNDEIYARAAAENYQKNPFLRVKNSQSKDGNIGYDVSFDAANLKNYMDSNQNDALVEDLNECFSTKSTDSSSSISSSRVERAVEQLNKIKITIWVSRWSHDLKGADIAIDSSDLSSSSSSLNKVDDFTVKIETKIDTKKGVTNETPSDAKSVDELVKSMNEIFNDSSSITKL